MELNLFYISFAIFTIGIVTRMGSWFTKSLWHLSEKVSTAKKLKVLQKGILSLITEWKIIKVFITLITDVLLQLRVLEKCRVRWIMHVFIFAGFIGLTFMHALEPLVSDRVFTDYYSTLNPYFFLREIFGILVLTGLGIALWRRIYLRKKGMMKSTGMDYGTLIIITSIIVSGILFEAAKIASESEFLQMVEDYAMIEDEELTALKTYWAKEYGLVTGEIRKPYDSSYLEKGFELNEENCISCHSSSKWAFTGYAITKTLPRSFLMELDNIGYTEPLRWIHYISCLIALAWLPFGKMFHMFSTPAGLIVNSVMGDRGSTEALAIRNAMALDTCTGCGTCSQFCSMRPAYFSTGNELVLPSEKITFFRKKAGRKSLSEDEFNRVRKGLTMCTDCGKCSDVCTSGIDLKHLWSSMKNDLLNAKKTDPMFISPLSFARGIAPEGVSNIEVENTKNILSGRFDVLFAPDRVLGFRKADKICDLSDLQSLNFYSCYNCGACTGSCPVVGSFSDPGKSLGLLPHQIIHSLKIRESEMAEGARMIWYCLTCYQCQENCPQNVRVTDIFYELKNRSYNRTTGAT